MKSSVTQESLENYSPQFSTEENSIHDNISINKQSLEKGLRNRPNQYVLVDRGILRNPGKAFSDKMSQLDLAKKRDKLKVKIANRPDRDELVRKLILQEQNDIRQQNFDRIKQLLDDSISNRPGSLELVDKNILQVDRLLVSRIHSGDITYPKVCGADVNYTDCLSSSNSTPLPSISEIDIPNTLNELSDLQSLSSSTSTKSTNSRNLQYSCKKTYRVGRYSFHNIEFRPAAQKAREYQQNQLVQFEEIQAQRNPNLKKIHSELATKSHHSPETNMQDVCCNTAKHSLLHRLNVHELKSECKIRMISCSNIPKVHLVEKLLPFEAEIIASHTSFDSSNRRSMPVIKSTRDFSPPEKNKNLNMPASLYKSTQNVNPLFLAPNFTKLIHSHSEPMIQNYINSQQPVPYANGNNFLPTSNSLQNSNFNYLHATDNEFRHFLPSLDSFSPNNSYPSLNYHNHQPNLSMNCETFPIKQQNILMPTDFCDSWNANNWKPLSNEHITHQQLSNSVSPKYTLHNNCNGNSLSENFCPGSVNYQNKEELPPIIIPSQIIMPPFNYAWLNKLDNVFKEVYKLSGVIENIKCRTKNNTVSNVYIDQYHRTQMDLIKSINSTMELINKETKLQMIDPKLAQDQLNWLRNLLNSTENNFQRNDASCVKIENGYYSESNKVSESNSNNNNGMILKNQVDGFETMNFHPIDTILNQRQNESFFFEPAEKEFKVEDIDTFDFNQLSLPETPLSEFMHSPFYNDPLDDLMNDVFNVTENMIS